jgi:hypothetical protein
MDLYNYLLRQRIIFLGGYVNDKVAMQKLLPTLSATLTDGSWCQL